MCEVVCTTGYYTLNAFVYGICQISRVLQKGGKLQRGPRNDQLRVGFQPKLSDRSTFGSYRCFTRRYYNYTNVKFDVFSLNKSSGGLASQNDVE